MVDQKDNSKKIDKTVSIAMQRCPHCGASDVSVDAGAGKLKCNFCRNTFEGKKANDDAPLKTFENAKGDVVASGASDIIPGEDVVETFKCPSCGAEVVVNTAKDLAVKCHWCRHILTASHKIPNGAVPDILLPFALTKEKAVEKMKDWLGQYKASVGDLISSLKLDEVQGVYFPYMVVDAKGLYRAEGKAEQTKSREGTASTVECYSITREFNLFVDDLTLESSSKRLNQDTAVNSNNVINAIMPFDTENAVVWNPNYLRGYSSERRDTNINDLKEVVALQCGDIGRQCARETTTQYDRGVHWMKDHISMKGVNWKAAYFPVWLFTFKNEKKPSDTRLYYIAVNARTGETDGVLPIEGVIFDKRIGDKARHFHEKETRHVIRDVKQTDNYVKTQSVVYSKEITNRNDNREIGSLSDGRSNMIAAEKARFKTGANYKSNSANSNTNGAIKIIFIILACIILIQLVGVFGFGSCIGCSRSSSSRSSSDSSYQYDYDDDWDYDYDSGSDSDWSSDWGSDSGFDYDYDY